MVLVAGSALTACARAAGRYGHQTASHSFRRRPNQWPNVSEKPFWPLRGSSLGETACARGSSALRVVTVRGAAHGTQLRHRVQQGPCQGRVTCKQAQWTGVYGMRVGPGRERDGAASLLLPRAGWRLLVSMACLCGPSSKSLTTTWTKSCAKPSLSTSLGVTERSGTT